MNVCMERVSKIWWLVLLALYVVKDCDAVSTCVDMLVDQISCTVVG